MIPSKSYGTMYYVDSMNEAISFYEKSLGMKATNPSDSWTEFDINGHLLCLHVNRPGEKSPENGILIMYKDGIQKLHDGMKGDGFNVFGLHQIYGDMYSFNFKDQFNNILSYYGKLLD